MEEQGIVPRTEAEGSVSADDEAFVRPLPWVTLARAALVLGLALFVAAVLVAALLPQGAAAVRLYLTQTHAAVHLLLIAFWPAATAALLALVAVFAVWPPASPAWARRVFVAVAVLLVAGGVYTLHVLNHAEKALYRLSIPGMGGLGFSFLSETASWLAWTAVLAWAAFCLAAVLVAAAVLARRGPAVAPGERPAVVDAPARRLALLAASTATVVVCVQAAYSHPWSSQLAVLAGRSAFGGRAWLAGAVLALGQLAWAVPALAAALAGRGPRLSWAAWAAAGACGAALSVKGLLHVVLVWTPTRLQGLVLNREATGGTMRLIEAKREHLLTSGIVQAVLLVVAVALLAAALRQAQATTRGRERSGRRVTSRSAKVAVAAAVAVAVVAPAVAAGAVGRGGSLLGFAAVAGLQSEPQQVPEATAPTPLAVPSPATAGPVVTGVIPGFEQTSRGGTSGNAVWSGDVVQVNYEPSGAKVDAARSRLLIDGDPVPVPATSLAMSRKTETLNWSLRRPLRRGRHEFRVVLVTGTGAEYSWGWSYSF